MKGQDFGYAVGEEGWDDWFFTFINNKTIIKIECDWVSPLLKSRWDPRMHPISPRSDRKDQV